MFGGDSAPYIQAFTSSELEMVVGVTNHSTPGPDGVHYRMLEHMSYKPPKALLKFYKYLQAALFFPEDWKTVHVIPLLNPGKDHFLPNTSYRAIALMSCLSKTYKKLRNNRLVYTLQSNNDLDVTNVGFGQGV